MRRQAAPLIMKDNPVTFTLKGAANASPSPGQRPLVFPLTNP